MKNKIDMKKYLILKNPPIIIGSARIVNQILDRHTIYGDTKYSIKKDFIMRIIPRRKDNVQYIEYHYVYDAVCSGLDYAYRCSYKLKINMASSLYLNNTLDTPPTQGMMYSIINLDDVLPCRKPTSHSYP